MSQKIAILWFRHDLRIHDHEALHRALEKADQILPVYCFDPRHFTNTPFGFPKTGPFRARFLLQSLRNLRQRLQSRGSQLWILHGKPEEEIPALASRLNASWIFAHEEVTREETDVEHAMEQRLFGLGISLERFWGSTLYHQEDLPMPIQSLPDIFTKFRKQVERYTEVRSPFPTPDTIVSPEWEQPGELPSLQDLGLPEPQPEQRMVLDFQGGEEAGLERLHTYFWERDCLQTYKETRNGLLGEDYSSKFSPWLALGCLSPRHIYQEVKRYEELRVANKSTYWLIFELIWRDYFRFVCKRYGDQVFYPGGIKQVDQRWSQNWKLFEAWQQGETGMPFVDANMRELKQTGFMSNRGRQNVASFLVKDLGLDWRMGAEWFESVLIDYDVCSNYGNWNYVAGVGNDPRENRYFNIPSQSRRYDAKAVYMKTWIPELAQIPTEFIHDIRNIPKNSLQSSGLELGVDYPHLVTEFKKRSIKRS